MTLNIVRGITRILIRIVADVIHRLVLNAFDTLFGFFNWPEKKLRIKIIILADHQGQPVLSLTDVDKAIEYAKRVFKKNLNVKLLPHHRQKSFAEVVMQAAPDTVLYTKGGIGALSEEFKTTGSYFASNLSGIFYPVTAFVVMDIKGASGCSLGPMSDYVTLDPVGAKDPSILAHELAHACGLWHLKDRSNLLWLYKDRGDKIRWWQKNIFRSSRHVTYW